MSEIRHLRCDRCGNELTVGSNIGKIERRWAHCRVGLESYDFCPNCWLEIKPKDMAEPSSEVDRG